MFLNLSNHKSSHWGVQQRAAAEKNGDIVDMDFPIVDASSTSGDISALAERFASDIIARYNPSLDVIHIMGEMTFTYALVRRLRDAGFTCLASTTERIKQQQPDGSFISEFRFQQFRQYE